MIFPPDIDFFQQTAEFAPQLMFGLLILSLLFLVFNQTRLMFIGLIAAAFLAFYLKMASNASYIYPTSTVLPKISVANFNLSELNQENVDIDNIFKELDVDIISFQEYTPLWDKIISQQLYQKFPYIHKLVKADPFGMAVYSKKPFKKSNIFYYEKIPNIDILIQNEMSDINIICCYIPTVYPATSMNNTDHLNVVSAYISKLDKPVIAMGDFHMNYWLQKLIDFTNITSLENSRRSSTIMRRKIHDHIFYSDYLECTHFEEIQDKAQNHIGIKGNYQLRSSLTSQSKRTLGAVPNFN